MVILACVCTMLGVHLWKQRSITTMMTMGLDSTGIVGKETNNGTANAISTDLLPEDEWLNDIENTDPSSVLGCGVFKCAFRSTTTTTMTTGSSPRGYLVTMELHPPGHPSDVDYLEEARRTFAMAEDLSRGWSVRHALLAPPVRLFGSEGPLSSSSSSSLSSSSSSSSSSRQQQQQQQQQQQKKKKLFETMYNSTKAVMLNAKAEWLESSSSAGGGSILVQPIALYSPDGVLFKCSDEYQKWALEAVANLTASSFGLEDDGDDGDDSDNDDGFASRLRWDLGVTVVAMQTSLHGPCLSKDFQVVLDPLGGTIVHIDLDRCFGTMATNWGPGCRATLKTLVEAMISRRETILLDQQHAAASAPA